MHMSSFDHLCDIFTKCINDISYEFSGANLGTFGLYTLAWGACHIII